MQAIGCVRRLHDRQQSDQTEDEIHQRPAGHGAEARRERRRRHAHGQSAERRDQNLVAVPAGCPRCEDVPEFVKQHAQKKNGAERQPQLHTLEPVAQHQQNEQKENTDPHTHREPGSQRQRPVECIPIRIHVGIRRVADCRDFRSFELSVDQRANSIEAVPSHAICGRYAGAGSTAGPESLASRGSVTSPVGGSSLKNTANRSMMTAAPIHGRIQIDFQSRV